MKYGINIIQNVVPDTTYKNFYGIEFIHIPSVLNGATAKEVELKLEQIQLNTTAIKHVLQPYMFTKLLYYKF